ncbi:OmpH family outer membrane protein [Gilvimarinus sp. F26214L]|uniref:OmpH family outer membrane protein n=1 Tax=Gilvimarinus sp. DZF01 TaxID=3461371 RepID=UPI0040463E40
MKKLTIALFATAMMACSGIALAEGKVAVFNLQAAILNTDTAQKQIKDYEAKAAYADLKANYDSLRSELQKLDEQAKKNGATWSDEQKNDHRKQMEYKRADLELVAKKLQSENQALVQQILATQAQKAREVVQDIIKSEGIGLVLNAEAVTYADSSYDITSKITDRLNKAR